MSSRWAQQWVGSRDLDQSNACVRWALPRPYSHTLPSPMHRSRLLFLISPTSAGAAVTGPSSTIFRGGHPPALLPPHPTPTHPPRPVQQSRGPPPQSSGGGAARSSRG